MMMKQHLFCQHDYLEPSILSTPLTSIGGLRNAPGGHRLTLNPTCTRVAGSRNRFFLLLCVTRHRQPRQRNESGRCFLRPDNGTRTYCEDTENRSTFEARASQLHTALNEIGSNRRLPI